MGVSREQRARRREASRKRLQSKSAAALEELKLRTPAQEVRRRLRAHAPRGKGLSNELVDSLCRACCSEEYRGAYSADCIPVALATLAHFIVVVNLGVRKHVFGPLPPGHFVTIAVTPTQVYYLDPYGMPCMQPDVARFLERCCSLRPRERKGVRNVQQVQHLDAVTCGFYAVLFAQVSDRAWTRRVSPAALLRRLTFYTRAGDLRKNDKLCKKYIVGMLLSK